MDTNGIALLVFGTTRFVGRALVVEALARDWDVWAVHRGLSGALPAGATLLLADRTAPGELVRALGEYSWDLVVDTWDGRRASPCRRVATLR